MSDGFIPLDELDPDVDFETLGQQPASDMSGPETPAGEPIPDEGQIDDFDPQVREDVRGLLFLGALSTEFELWGHTFVMKTLTVGEDLAAAQIIKDYEGTLAKGKAYAMAQVAAAMVSVDGRSIVEELGPDDTLVTVRKKFAYVRQRWYWPVIERLYDEFSRLNVRQAAALAAYEGKGAAGRPTSMAFAGSLSDRAF